MKRFLALAGISFALVALADSYVYVDEKRGNDDTADGTWELPAKTIKKGIKLARVAAETKVIVSVQPGTYPGGIIFTGKGAGYYDYEDGLGAIDRSNGHIISVRGQTGNVDNANPRLVVIDAGGWTNCVAMAGANATLCNVTCTNGVFSHHQDSAPQWIHVAGGIALYYGATASNCVVTGCINRDTSGTDHQGGGVFLRGTGSMLIDSTVENCAVVISPTGHAYAYGGGIAMMDNSGEMTRNVIVSNCCCISERSNSSVDKLLGGGVWCGSGYGKLASATIVDCYTTNAASGTIMGSGGGIAMYHWPSAATNCIVRNCRATVGVGVCCDWGARLYDTVVTNCSGSGAAVYSGSADNNKDNQMALFYGVTVTDCKVDIGLNAGGAHVYNCLIENNTCSSHALKLYASDSRTVPHTGSVQRVVVRNNTTSGHVVSLTTGMPLTMAGCWFVDNTAPSGKAVVSAWDSWLGTPMTRELLIAGNTAGYGLYTGGKGPNSPWSGMTGWTTHCGLTIVSNTFSGAAVNIDGYSNLGYCALTNCFIGANGCAKSFSANAVNLPVGNISHCFVGETANIPDDPGNTAENVTGRTAKMRAGTWVPRVACGARDAGVALDYRDDPRYRSMGDGTFSVERVGLWGVRIVSNAPVTRFCGKAPDIGAAEAKPTGLMMLVR